MTLFDILAVVLPPLAGLVAFVVIFWSSERYRREVRKSRGTYGVSV